MDWVDDHLELTGAGVIAAVVVLGLVWCGWFASTHECVRHETVQETTCIPYGKYYTHCTTRPAEECAEWKRR